MKVLVLNLLAHKCLVACYEDSLSKADTCPVAQLNMPQPILATKERGLKLGSG